ncbi:hypothetical protein BT93_C1374 [Corymbia citriodora subsp. variegata]|nr:hypothetical protein BT93_C1374 [Corymbia citriodora subsp. variegata]
MARPGMAMTLVFFICYLPPSSSYPIMALNYSACLHPFPTKIQTGMENSSERQQCLAKETKTVAGIVAPFAVFIDPEENPRYQTSATEKTVAPTCTQKRQSEWTCTGLELLVKKKRSWVGGLLEKVGTFVHWVMGSERERERAILKIPSTFHEALLGRRMSRNGIARCPKS